MTSVVGAGRDVGADQAGLDAVRTARLLFDAELAAGRLSGEAVRADAVLDALRADPVPGLPQRAWQEVARKLGRLDHHTATDRLLTVRRAVLGDRAAAPPRFLVRVDEYPHFKAWDEPERFGASRFEQFHEIMHAAGVPYLVAVLPRLSHAPLDPRERRTRPLDDRERELLRRIRRDGVGVALHGRDHRTRFASPRRHSELVGLSLIETEDLLEQALAELAMNGGGRPDVFVAPYNRFDARQWPLLAKRFSVICGGPESIRCVGYQSSPQWRGGSVYLPAYPPFYGRAATILAAAHDAIENELGLWSPVVLHWGWEAEDGWHELVQLLELIAPYAARWEDFQRAIERST